MPGMDGIETLKWLRERNPDAQVVLLTGRVTVRKATEAMRLGALGLLAKPVNIEVLIEKNKMRLTEKRIEAKMAAILFRKSPSEVVCYACCRKKRKYPWC